MPEFIRQINAVTETQYQNDSLKATNLHNYLQMSRSALHYKLKKHLGQSTAQYLCRFRINKAKTLLKDTNESIKVIAFQVGFKDPNYFSRVFRKETGISPSVFRKMYKLDNNPGN